MKNPRSNKTTLWMTILCFMFLLTLAPAVTKAQTTASDTATDFLSFAAVEKAQLIGFVLRFWSAGMSGICAKY